MELDRPTLLKLVAGLFGIFVAVGAALFRVEGHHFEGSVGLVRVPLVVLGAVGLAATAAFHARLPASRPLLLATFGAGILAALAYLGGMLWLMLQAPAEEFRKGKLPTLVVGLALSGAALALLLILLRAIARDGRR